MYPNKKFDRSNLKIMNYGININDYTCDLLLTNEKKTKRKQ